MINTLNKQLTGSKQPNGQLSSKGNDVWKWILVAVAVVVGVVGNFLLIEQSIWYQTALWLVVVGVTAVLVFFTAPGIQLIQFFKDSRQEIRKVVWPTRQETLQASLMVLVAVAVMSVLLWVIDLILFRIINFLTT